MRPPPGAEEGSRASGSGRQDASLLCQAKWLPGTATGQDPPLRLRYVSVLHTQHCRRADINSGIRPRTLMQK